MIKSLIQKQAKFLDIVANLQLNNPPILSNMKNANKENEKRKKMLFSQYPERYKYDKF